MAPRRQATGPEVIIRGPSTEIQRNEAPRQADRQNTGLISKWLDQHGVPVNNNRQMKPKKSKDPNAKAQSITASNVTTMELEAYFKWSFQASADVARQDKELRVSGISKVLNGINQIFNSGFTSEGKANLNGRIGTMISLPSEWTDRNGSMSLDGGDGFWRHALMMYLHYHDPNRMYVNFLPKEQIKSTTYPNPNVFHMHNKRYEGGGIAWTLTNTLGAPTFGQQPETEMDVEHLVSGFLNGYFNVSDCETTSNAQLKFREEITCFGSHPHPDFVARIKEGLIKSRICFDLYPVVSLAEAKRDATKKNQTAQPGLLEVPSEMDSGGFQFPTDKFLKNPERLPMAAQLAFAAYPSLVIIIASLITQWRSKAQGKKLERKEYEIPEWAVIYGVGYAGNGILIYAFSPRIIEWDENNFPKKWGFLSVLASRDFTNVFRNKPKDRFNVVRVLLMLQQHANRLKDHIKSEDFRLPEEFLE